MTTVIISFKNLETFFWNRSPSASELDAKPQQIQIKEIPNSNFQEPTPDEQTTPEKKEKVASDYAGEITKTKNVIQSSDVRIGAK